jgi:hypothetical protein
LNAASGLTECIIQVFHDVETIYHAANVLEFFFGCFMISIPHVGTTDFDLIAPLLATLIEPFE